MTAAIRYHDGVEYVEVGPDNPLPVNQIASTVPQDLGRLMALTDPMSVLAMQGCKFYSSDADQNDLVTGQTSLAATSPTFLLDVPFGTSAIPLFLGLNQAGTVAGADIFIAIEIDGIKRYASGGTAEKIMNARPGLGTKPKCVFYSNPTAIANGYGIRTSGVQVAADTSPAEGAIYEYVWTPAGSLDILDGPGSWLVYTYAGTTGPSWVWTAAWIEVPTAWLPASGLAIA